MSRVVMFTLPKRIATFGMICAATFAVSACQTLGGSAANTAAPDASASAQRAPSGRVSSGPAAGRDRRKLFARLDTLTATSTSTPSSVSWVVRGGGVRWRRKENMVTRSASAPVSVTGFARQKRVATPKKGAPCGAPVVIGGQGSRGGQRLTGRYCCSNYCYSGRSRHSPGAGRDVRP